MTKKLLEKMRDLGRIVTCQGNMAQVSIQPHGGCKDCALKSSCSPGESTHTLWALNPKEGKAGDDVVVELKPEVKVFGSALVFIFPLIGLFIGYFLGSSWGGGKDYSILGALFGLGVFFLLVRLIDKFLSKNKKMKPVISHIFK